MRLEKLCYYNPRFIETTNRFIETDICIYGGNAAGIATAIQAARMGQRAVVLEPSGKLGGMTASGLSNTDSGQKHTVGGISREFYQRAGRHYGIDEEWKFEPHVAERVLSEMIDEAGVAVYYYQFLQSVCLANGYIESIELEGGLRVRARVFIDCSYEGDLMAQSGVSYTVGREDNIIYGEAYNGVQIAETHQFDFPVDPYCIPGDSLSGLLPGIDSSPLPPVGSGDRRLQAYNFRLCLSRDPANRIPFEKPEGYNELEYELGARYLAAGFDRALCSARQAIRGNKVDSNNSGGLSSDFIGRNYEYPEGSYARREQIYQEHVTYHKGLMWFCRYDPRVPEVLREEIAQWGLAADEFTSTGGWPHQLYVREARRMISGYIMTEHDCLSRRSADDPVGMASYTMDAHNARRFIRDGRVLNEGNVEIPVEPFGISLRSILPLRSQCKNLVVPVCLAASHIAYGSIRMEPVFMILGQSAATVAVLAIEDKCSVQEVDYNELRTQLERDGQCLEENVALLLPVG